MLWSARIGVVGIALALEDSEQVRTAAAVLLVLYISVVCGAFLPLRVTTDAVHRHRKSPAIVRAPAEPEPAPAAEPGDAMDVDADAGHDISLGPQRFWAPEPPSGLEDLFGQALQLDAPSSAAKKRRWGHSARSVAWPALLAAGAAIVVAGAAVTVALAAGAAAVLTTDTRLSHNLLGRVVGTLR